MHVLRKFENLLEALAPLLTKESLLFSTSAKIHRNYKFRVDVARLMNASKNIRHSKFTLSLLPEDGEISVIQTSRTELRLIRFAILQF
ncbi:hypothetical protein BHE16_04675 [Neomicrococcus aestuarii]|uniref:Uncharacterized protein n=1 Tax=Neomicrococcus aestuarii TaxID=556325 RepID=A0A1L2ZM18_9MICC|nr:hypothetical protein BHE16_04675 [Neomicrococcus aestuarii]